MSIGKFGTDSGTMVGKRKSDVYCNKTTQLQPPPPDVQLSTFQSWEAVGNWYNALQMERAKPTPEIRAKAEELTKLAKDDNARLQAIYEYVSTQFRYIGVDF